MFGISFAELVIITLLVLVVMGPEKLPQVARWAGKGLRELRQASNTLRNALEVEDPGTTGAVGTGTSNQTLDSDSAAGSDRSPPGAGQGTEIGAEPGESPPPSNIDQVDDRQFDEMLDERVRAHRDDETQQVELADAAGVRTTTTVGLPAATDPSEQALIDVRLPSTTAPEPLP